MVSKTIDLSRLAGKAEPTPLPEMVRLQGFASSLALKVLIAFLLGHNKASIVALP